MLFSLWFHYFALICSVSLQSVMVRDVYPICLFFSLEVCIGLVLEFSRMSVSLRIPVRYMLSICK